MIRLCIFLTFLMCLISTAYADSSAKFHEQIKISKQKNNLAKEMGIILIGMTKTEVKDVFYFMKPKIWFTTNGNEVWSYETPEKQDIYFNDNKVDSIQYF